MDITGHSIGGRPQKAALFQGNRQGRVYETRLNYHQMYHRAIVFLLQTLQETIESRLGRTINEISGAAAVTRSRAYTDYCESPRGNAVFQERKRPHGRTGEIRVEHESRGWYVALRLGLITEQSIGNDDFIRLRKLSPHRLRSRFDSFDQGEIENKALRRARSARNQVARNGSKPTFVPPDQDKPDMLNGSPTRIGLSDGGRRTEYQYAKIAHAAPLRTRRQKSDIIAGSRCCSCAAQFG